MAPRTRILLIDDNEDYLQVLTVRLRTDGFEVVTANSGQGGLRILASEPFDLILLDMLMPEKDGITTYEEIRANPKTQQIPLILLTGVAVEGHWQPMANESDGRAFVMGKPYNYVELVARINLVLTRAKGAS